MQIGFKIFAEGLDPKAAVAQAVRAEQAGFDFVEVSDHYHPWLYSHGHSGFVWSMLAAMAVQTERIGLATGVTCPTIRYHPAIIAQAAATTQILADGRFTLGVGSGERLNEHVVGDAWPNVTVRQAMLREAIEVIKLLWQGGYQSHRGAYYTVDDAQVFDLPDTLPIIAVAAGGTDAAALAAEVGDGLFATDPDPGLVAAYADAGGAGPRYAEVPLAWAPDAESAAASVHALFRFGALDWKVMAELPNPVNFEAATEYVTPDHLADAFACGPDVERHLEVVRQFADAGFDHLALINAGPDPEGFFGFFETALRERLPA